MSDTPLLLIPLLLALAACGPDVPPPVTAPNASGGGPNATGFPTPLPRSDGQRGSEVTADSNSPFSIKAEDRHYRAPTYKDLAGRWKQIGITALSEVDLAPPWFSGEQMFAFTEHGRMKTFLVPPPEVADQETAYAAWRGRKPTIEYQILDDDGMIEIKEPGGKTYIVVATYYTRDHQALHEGDLTLTYLDKKTRASLFYRLLRRED